MATDVSTPKKKAPNWFVALFFLAIAGGLYMMFSGDDEDQPTTETTSQAGTVTSNTTGIGTAAELLLDITPGMTPERVQQKVGAPVEKRIAGSGSAEWWMYGPDTNQAVTFMDGVVLNVTYDVAGTNRKMAEITKSAPGDDRLFRVTPGMTPEMVIRTVGQPQEVRETGGTAELWIYGPDGNQSVTFMDGTVLTVTYDIRGTNRQMQQLTQ